MDFSYFLFWMLSCGWREVRLGTPVYVLIVFYCICTTSDFSTYGCTTYCNTGTWRSDEDYIIHAVVVTNP